MRRRTGVTEAVRRIHLRREVVDPQIRVRPRIGQPVRDLACRRVPHREAHRLRDMGGLSSDGRLGLDTDTLASAWTGWAHQRSVVRTPKRSVTARHAGACCGLLARTGGPIGGRLDVTKGVVMSATEIDEGKLEAFMGQAVTDMGAIISGPLMLIGEKLGLYKAMAHAGPLTSQEVAERSGAAERYVREWLGNQAAGGYVTYDPESDRYTLPDEHALALADEDSPFYILGVYDSIASLYADEDQIIEAFRSGEGMGWHEHDHRLFRGTERFFRPGYRAHLVAEWIPALAGVQEKLEGGAKVADIGCGHGASTVIMADAFPKSEFFGFDYHDASIERAREAAAEAGVGDRIKFE